MQIVALKRRRRLRHAIAVLLLGVFGMVLVDLAQTQHHGGHAHARSHNPNCALCPLAHGQIEAVDGSPVLSPVVRLVCESPREDGLIWPVPTTTPVAPTRGPPPI